MYVVAVYWTDLDGLFYGVKVFDCKRYGHSDDLFIYGEFAKPIEFRAMSEQELLRSETVEV